MLARCYTCGSPEQVQWHHLDWDHGNNSTGNLVPLCQRCHSAVHGRCGHMTRSELEVVRLQVIAREPQRFQRTPEAPVSTLVGQLDLFED